MLSRGLLAVVLSLSSGGATDRWLASAVNATTSCPAGLNDPLATALAPVLSADCGRYCPDGSLCIYYPSAFADRCVATAERTCVQADGCAFECISQATGADGWWITLYTDPAVLDEIGYSNGERPNEPAIGINASLVTSWMGDVVVGAKRTTFYVAGNEAANNYGIEARGDYLGDTKSFAAGTVVPFELPPRFLEKLVSFKKVRVENLKLPVALRPNASLSFTTLEELYLRNTLLSSFPLQGASFGALNILDLSFNRFTNVSAWLPRQDKLQVLNMTRNAVTAVDPGVLSPILEKLDLSFNPLRELAIGTLPPTLVQLHVENTLLTAVPADVTKMDKLMKLYLDNLALKEIPENVLPTESMYYLSLDNCSLTSIPPDVKKMTKLEFLTMSENDFSRGFNVSALPPSLVRITLDSCKLQKLPAEFKRLPNLVSLYINNNPNAMGDLSVLPANLTEVYLTNNSLTTMPPVFQTMKGLVIMYMEENPLESIPPRSIPESMISLFLSNTVFRELPANSLPAAIKMLSLKNAQLEVAPEDIRAMEGLTYLDFSNCRLRTMDVAVNILPLSQIDVSSNRLVRFAGVYPGTRFLDLRNNSIAEFNVTSAPVLEILHLAQNNLTSMPAAIFNLPKLTVLNLTGNPIRGFAPTPDQLKFLSQIPTAIFDPDMFETACTDSDKISFQGFAVCTSRAATSDGSKANASAKTISVGAIAAIVCVVLLLVVGILYLCRRQKRQENRKRKLASEAATLEENLLDDAESSIWSDPVLLQHRLPAELVACSQLLGAGMFGNVHLATYGGDHVAVKSLKSADRRAIHEFVDEIKLALTLSHPRIVQAVGVTWTKESDIALVTEYLSGGDLREYLEHTAKTPGWSTQMLRVALETAEAVAYLHSLSPVVIHRDLKSRNVLLDAALHAKLSDFGVSRFKLDDETMTAGVGTVRWIAPEVLAGQRYDESVDVYSLGIILSEIDTRKLPFADVVSEDTAEPLSDSAIAALLMSGSLQCSLSDACPLTIRRLVNDCTAFDPTKRPVARQVVDELKKLLDDATSM